jgi:hypothetical protein
MGELQLLTEEGGIEQFPCFYCTQSAGTVISPDHKCTTSRLLTLPNGNKPATPYCEGLQYRYRTEAKSSHNHGADFPVGTESRAGWSAGDESKLTYID